MSESPAPISINPESLAIVHYPAEVLRQKATKVDPSPEVLAVGEKMIQLMHDAPGIGLAAPQVGLPWRLFVADVPPDRNPEAQNPEAPNPSNTPPSATAGPEIYIDPVISKPQGTREYMEEGCLSLPGILGDVLRPPTVTMTYTDQTGRRIAQKATGLLARCWQHEMDHLDGVLIIDRFSKPDRLRIKAKLEKFENDAKQ